MKDKDKESLSPMEREAKKRSAGVGQERRRLIRHTQNERSGDLTPEEIEARIRAFSEKPEKKRPPDHIFEPDDAESENKRSHRRRSARKEQPAEELVSREFTKEIKEKPKKEKLKPAKSKTASQERRKRVEPPRSADPEPEKPDFLKEEEPIDMDDFRKARKKLKMRKRMKRLIIVLVLVIIAAAVYFTRGLWVPKLEGILDKKHDTIVNEAGLVHSGNFPLVIDDRSVSQLSRIDGNFVTVDGGHLLTYDTNGKLRDTAFHSFGNPMIRSAGKRMLLFDHGGTGVKLYGKTGEIFDKHIDGTVILGDIAENGNVLVVYETDKYITKAVIYDKNGTLIYNWENGDKIMDAAFSDDGKSCAFTTFSVSDGKLISRVTRANITISDSFVVSDPIDGLVINAKINTEGNIFALTKDALYLISDAGNILVSSSFDYMPEHYAMSSSSVCVSVKGLGHSGSTLCVFDAADLTLTPVRPANDLGTVKRIRCFDGMTFVLGSDKLNCYGPDGSVISTAELSDSHTDFVYCDDAVYLLGRSAVNKLVFRT